MSFLISRMGRRSHTSLVFTGNILDITLMLVFGDHHHDHWPWLTSSPLSATGQGKRHYDHGDIITLLLVLVIMATVITVITRGSVFKYKCDRGFRMHGSSLLTCAGCGRRWCWWWPSYLTSKWIIPLSSTWEDRLTNLFNRRPWLGSVKASFVCKWD